MFEKVLIKTLQIPQLVTWKREIYSAELKQLWLVSSSDKTTCFKLSMSLFNICENCYDSVCYNK